MIQNYEIEKKITYLDGDGGDMWVIIGNDDVIG